MSTREDDSLDRSEQRPATSPDTVSDSPKDEDKQPREIGGRDGPDPTRYGDWEKNGRCIDF